MKKLTFYLIITSVLASFIQPAFAGAVKLPLACEGQYNAGQSWTTEFDLGVTFRRIDRVYIDWSGTITAEILSLCTDSNTTWSIDGKFVVRLSGANAYYVRGGGTTHPNPEPFELQSQLHTANYAPGQLLVQFSDGNTTDAERNAILASYGGGTVKRSYTLVPGLSSVTLPPDVTVEEAISILSNAPEILYAEPNYLLYPSGPPFYGPPPPWLALFHGQGSITIWFGKIYRSLDLCTINHPIGQIHSATLVIEGKIIGETLLVPDQYSTIQEAIDAAYDGDTVLVADGIYTGDGNRDIDFLGKAITLRSENGPNNCIIDCNGTAAEPHKGFYFYSGEDANSILDGLTIKNGYAGYGGGIECSYSSPTIKNCKIIGNRTGYAIGGGVFGYNTNVSITDCVISGNYAGNGCGVYIHHGAPVIDRCLISNNYSGAGGRGALYFQGGTPGVPVTCYPKITNCLITGNLAFPGGICCWWGGSEAIIRNCTIVNNRPYAWGGAIYWSGAATVTNCICRGNHLMDLSLGGRREISEGLTVNYTNIQDNGSPADWKYVAGIGNIDDDPCFADPCTGDYRLLLQSLCINAGDPNYVPEPNETDLDGLPRVIGGRIDMGAYEFNHCPVADAGPNQITYAFIDGLADVNLDGSASYDDDNDVLDYYWSWAISPNLCEANGISPCITLPIGEHEIELIVDDGIDESQPDYCTITVIEPRKASLSLWPSTINCNTKPNQILALMRLPRDIKPQDVKDEPLTVYPYDIESKYQLVYRPGRGRYARTTVLAVFSRDDICAALQTPGRHQIKIAGRLITGQYFYGIDTIRIVTPRPHPWPLHRFYRSH